MSIGFDYVCSISSPHWKAEGRATPCTWHLRIRLQGGDRSKPKVKPYLSRNGAQSSQSQGIRVLVLKLDYIQIKS